MGEELENLGLFIFRKLTTKVTLFVTRLAVRSIKISFEQESDVVIIEF